MNSEELIMNNEEYKCYAFDVGAGPVSAQKNKITKSNANVVGACIARPQEDKNNANAVGAESISAQIKLPHAITLIALIITIIIMLILAGVVLSLTLGEHGIFSTAQNAGIKYNEQEAREKLETVLVSLQVDKVTKPDEYNENGYIDNELTKNNIKISGDIVAIDGWQFKINRNTLEIGENLGKLTKEEMLLPTITKFDIKKVKNNITVSLKLRNEENAKITYTIKKEGEENDLEKIENETNLEHTFSNLELGKYIISIHTENEHGTDDSSKTIEITISIDFDESNKELWVGAEKNIQYTSTPENISKDNLKWSSSNPDIVQIDENGKLTALKKGTAVITATLNDITSTCKIDVKNNIFEDIAKSGKTIEELGMSLTTASLEEFKFDATDMKGMFGGGWNGYSNWSFNFTVPGNVFKEKGVSSITAVWDLDSSNESWWVSTCTGEIEIVYEDEEIETIKTKYIGTGYVVSPDGIEEWRLMYSFKNKPIKNITFKSYGYNDNWGGSSATLKAILY